MKSGPDNEAVREMRDELISSRWKTNAALLLSALTFAAAIGALVVGIIALVQG
jgi:hypothetical protein